MNTRNPYTINFGKIPKQYISRDVLITEIIDSLESNGTEEQAFKITGIRGTGKIIQKDKMSVSELLEITKQTHNSWSEPRKRLIEKGILDGTLRGEIKIVLPRFKEYVEKNVDYK